MKAFKIANSSILMDIYERLLSLYGPQGWWPLINYAGSPPTKTGSIQGYHPGNYDLPENNKQIYEIMLGAILVQNTNWKLAEQALLRLNYKTGLDPEKILQLNTNDLKETIRCAGFYNQKANYILNITDFFIKLEGSTPQRKEILAIKGVGEETADSILLYAYHKPEFVVDAYTRRIFNYLDFINEKAKYKQVKELFELNLPEDVPLFQEYHALIVEHAKRHFIKKPYKDETLQEFKIG